jgi:hypothetical protein
MANSDPTDVFSFTPKHLPDFKWDGKPETYEEFARRWKLYLIVMGFKRLRTEGYTSTGADGAQVPDAAKNGDNGSANAAKKEITWAAFLSALDHKWFAASRRHEETYDVDGVLGDMKRQACCSGLESQMTKEFLAMTQQPGEDLTTFHNRLTVKADLCGFNRRIDALDFTGAPDATRRRVKVIVGETMVLKRLAACALEEQTRIYILQGIEDEKTEQDIVDGAKQLQDRLLSMRPSQRPVARVAGGTSSTSGTQRPALPRLPTTPSATGSQSCMQQGCGLAFTGTWRRDHLLAGKCKAQFTCRGCHSPGHHIFQCTQRVGAPDAPLALTHNQGDNRDGLSTLSSTACGTGGKFHVSGLINGQARRILSDSGADVSVMGLPTARLYGLKLSMLQRPLIL